MKKIISTLFLFYCVLNTQAQNLELGIKAGLNRDKIELEDLQNLSAKIEANTTINIGAYLRLSTPFGLYIQPEAVFNRRASNFKIDLAGLQAFSHTANYVDVPVLVGWRFLKTFRLYGGPNFQFLMKQITEIPNNADFKLESLKDQTTGFQVGAGLDILKLRFDVKYDFNTSDMGSAFSYKGIAPTLQNKMVTIQVGLKLYSLL
jgi:hypothetical protein